jgi:hypothetical protein
MMNLWVGAVHDTVRVGHSADHKGALARQRSLLAQPWSVDELTERRVLGTTPIILSAMDFAADAASSGCRSWEMLTAELQSAFELRDHTDCSILRQE